MLGSRAEAVREVLAYVRPLVLNSARVVEASLKPDGLTVGMRAVLETLSRGGPCAVPAIGRHLDLPRQGVQRHVTDLVALGYVEPRPNPAHRRSSLIALTAAGRGVFDRINETEMRELATLVPDCDDDELRTAVKVMAALDRDVRRKASKRRADGP